MKNLRIGKIITALIIIMWVPSSYAAPPSYTLKTLSPIESPSSTFSSSAYIVTTDAKSSLNFTDDSSDSEENSPLVAHLSDSKEFVKFEYCREEGDEGCMFLYLFNVDL